MMKKTMRKIVSIMLSIIMISYVCVNPVNANEVSGEEIYSYILNNGDIATVVNYKSSGKVISKVYIATVYKGNIIKNLIMDCQSYTKYRPNETTGGIFVSWRRKEELPTGA